MALNTKAALSICGLFIAGLCYLVKQVGLPLQTVVAPAHVSRTASLATDGAVAARPRTTAAPAPSGVLPRFARGNPVELQAAADQAAPAPLAVVALPPPATTARLVSLPPVARPELGEVPVADLPVALMATAPTQDAAPDLPAAGTVLAAAGPSTVSAAGRTDSDIAGRTIPDRYAVRKGDSLTRIARRLWNSGDRRLVQLLVEANPELRARPNRLFVGEELVVPDRFAAHTAAADDDKPAAAPAVAQITTTTPPRWYTIRKGDSLAGIARRYLSDAGRWREIDKVNELRDPNRIVPGMRIKLPALASLQG